MILYPAIDLKDGQAVRLIKGEMDQATVFHDHPATQAIDFENAGCAWIHLVDLNGAFAGEPVNRRAIEEILSSVSVPCQLGGGIRDLNTIEAWVSRGLERVILGTVAVEIQIWCAKLYETFPIKLLLG
jgi:phosphoribosylformimino-5-aminoimidazole carboxamide ribotide isomerase